MPRHIITGTAAPVTTPDVVGQHFIDTVSGLEYISTGTSSSADWKVRGSGGGGSAVHPATKAYCTVLYPDDGILEGFGHFLASKDGGETFVRTGDSDNAAPGVTDALLPQSTSTDKFQNVAQGAGKVFLIGAGRELSGGTAGNQFIRVTDDLGVTWQALRHDVNTDANSGAAQAGSLPYDRQWANIAWDGSMTYGILCHDSDGTNKYMIKSTDGGASWVDTVISGALLTDIETLNYHPCNGGLWYFDGFWWAALQRAVLPAGPGNTDVTIYKSADLVTWSSFHTFNTGTDELHWGERFPTNNTPAGGIGVTVSPTLGAFFWFSNQTNVDLEIWRQTGEASAPTKVMTSGLTLMNALAPSASVAAAAITPDVWAKGYCIDPDDTTERLFVCAETDWNQFLFWTEDGTTWNADGYFPEIRQYSTGDSGETWFGWDGYAFIWGFTNGSTDRGFYRIMDGKNAQMHRGLNVTTGSRHFPDHIVWASQATEMVRAMVDYD